METEARVRTELVSGEQLLWSGRPRRGLRLRKVDALLIPFSLIWCGVLGLAGADAAEAGAGWYLLAFTPLVLIGLYLLVGHVVLDAWRRERTVYGLTDCRALIAGGLLRRRVTSFPLATVPFVHLRAGPDGRGTISFGAAEGWSIGGKDVASAFVMVDDARRVHALIHQIRADQNRQQEGAPNEGRATAPPVDLPAPEAEVLVHGLKTSDSQALKLALKELVVRKDLRFVSEQTRGSFGRTKRTDLLIRPADRDPVADRSLSAILAIFPAAGSRAYSAGGRAVPIEDLAKELFTHAQKGNNGTPGTGRGYVRREVLPSLEGRGLYARDRYRRLGLFDAIRWAPTAAGLAARTDLQARLVRRGSDGWGLTGELRARAGFAGTTGDLDAAFAAIDACVDRARDAVFGD